TITDDTANSVHPPFTWSIKQVVGHLIDCERVFGYRAARFAAGDDTPLPSFDENLMVAEMDYQQVPLPELIDEWRDLRRANLRFYQRLSPQHWERRGDSAGNALSVRAIGFILVGHTIHHLKIIRQRLGKTR
ncbi:MAG TPA: DinB family protein, partial [Pirellulaceae bacterium]|nr:DinB family protein [Pirellulaceae bacterium]